MVAGRTSDAFALLKTFQSLGGVIGFGISPLLAIDGGKTSDPKQLQLEIAMTAASLALALAGFVFYSGTNIPRHVKTEQAAQPVGGMYSQAVAAQGMLHCAGQVGLRPGQQLDALAGDVAAQTRQACENMVLVLRAGGCEPQDVVKTTVFLSDIQDFAAMNAVYREYFGRKPSAEAAAEETQVGGEKILLGSEPPARSAFAVKTLPGGALVEIEATAEIPRYPQFESSVVSCRSFC